MIGLDTDSSSSNDSDDDNKIDLGDSGGKESDEYNFDLIEAAIRKINSTTSLDMYEKRTALRELKCLCTDLYEQLNITPQSDDLARWFYEKEDVETNTQLRELYAESQRLLRCQRECRVIVPTTITTTATPVTTSNSMNNPREIAALKDRLIVLWTATHTPESDVVRKALTNLTAESHPLAQRLLEEAVEKLSGNLCLYHEMISAPTAKEQQELEKRWTEQTEGMGIHYPSRMWKKT
eukprot:PhF_6_TR13594/c0_g1_i1/m.21751